MSETEKKNTEATYTKKWADREEKKITKDVQVSENNKRYAEWWCENLSKKACSVIIIVKYGSEMSTGKKVWAKNAVRVKLYNSLNGMMEEHSLSDVLNAHVNMNSENPFPENEGDEKLQVNNIGTYYISSDIYNFIRTKWLESLLVKEKEEELSK